MSYDVVISQTIGGVGLRLCEAERDPAGHVDYLTVELRERFHFARTRVCMTEGHGLLQLFEWIARDWKGWTGEREWRSIEGDLTLTCSTNPMGDVLVVVTLHALSAFPPPWGGSGKREVGRWTTGGNCWSDSPLPLGGLTLARSLSRNPQP